MTIRTRYLSAVVVNLLLPWLAYRLALPHWGLAGALAASTIPLVVWLVCDLARFHHFDALSAVVLVGTLFSLAALMVGHDSRKFAIEEPVVSGVIGVGFLLSLVLRRPLVYYLARSTMAREGHDGTARFDDSWRSNPVLPGALRMLTLVWGIGLIGENVLRVLVVSSWPNQPWTLLASRILQYGIYGALTGWTLWYRSTRLRRPGRDQEAISDRLERS
jgi:hypothetical protein